MRKKIAALLTAMAMMLVMAVPAMATPFQANYGDAYAQNNNATYQYNAGAQKNAQLAVLGSNYSKQYQYQANYNATKQNANATAGNAFIFGW